MSLISSILSIIDYIDFATQNLLLSYKLEKQTYIFNSSISAKSLSNFSTIRFCSANGGIGTNLGKIIGTVNCFILVPTPLSNKRFNTYCKYLVVILSNNITTNTLTIGK